VTGLKGYSEYKETGLKWLGRVPASWGIVPLWTLYSRGKSINFPDEKLLSIYRDHGVVPKSSRDDNFNKPSEDLTPYQLVQPGDMVINKMKAWQGSVAISRHRGIVSPAYFVYERHHSMDDRYLHYLLRSERYITGYLSLSKGIRINQWDLDPTYHSRMPVLVPSMQEQRGIVDLLDRETAQIDNLIGKQQRLIELLAEKRQAIITHAVTKGLDPTPPTKPSGIPWLGGVAAHWTIVELKHVTDVITGFPFRSEDFSAESEDIPLLRGVNVNPGKTNWADTVRLPRSQAKDYPNYRLELGDLVLGLDRPIVSDGLRVCAIRQEDLPALLLQRVARIRTNGLADQNFVGHVLSSSVFANYLGPLFTGVSVPHMSPGQLGEFKIALPSLDEQKAVSHNLDLSLKKLDDLTARARSVIRLLGERRSALISAAVTGKIKVHSEGISA
jgi:type I restriction enzyme S subunit